MTKFISQPHEIEAFQFFIGAPAPPEWFVKAVEESRAFVVINNNDQYIIVQTKEGWHKARVGDWVCINASGTMFVLSDEELRRGFTKKEE